jgi:hypothetical protein
MAMHKKDISKMTDNQLNDYIKLNRTWATTGDEARLKQALEEITKRGYSQELGPRGGKKFVRGMSTLRSAPLIGALTGLLSESADAAIDPTGSEVIGQNPAIENPSSLDYMKRVNQIRLMEAIKKRRGN